MHSVHLISVEQSPRTVLGACCEEGMGGGGVLVFQEMGTMKSLYWRCEMWFDCVERKRRAKLPASATAPCALPCRAVVPGVHACVHMYILYESVYMCMCVCVRTCILYIYACVCVFVYVCVYTHVYVYVHAYLCIDYGSQYQCFSVWTVSCMRMYVRVHMYACTYVCRYIHMCIFLQ